MERPKAPSNNGAARGQGSNTLEPIAPGHGKSEAQHRRELCAAGRLLRGLGLIPAAAGNLSVRLRDGRILVTPAGLCKGELAPEDLILIDGDGAAERSRCVSSEIRMHLRIYALQPKALCGAVCHAHPAVATGYAAAGRALDRAVLAEAVILLGAVPVAPFAAPGTEDLADSIAPLVTRTNAILLANHGVVTYGPDLRTALRRMELVEHTARVTLTADLLGGPKLLSRSDVAALLASRERYGIPPAPDDAPPLLAAEDVKEAK
jgi:L-fuculose-phosphate aldolase